MQVHKLLFVTAVLLLFAVAPRPVPAQEAPPLVAAFDVPRLPGITVEGDTAAFAAVTAEGEVLDTRTWTAAKRRQHE